MFRDHHGSKGMPSNGLALLLTGSAWLGGGGLSAKLIGAILAIVFAQACATSGTSTQQENARTMIWADEFDVAGLPDTSKWAYDVGSWGWGNNELQAYTSARLENARVENGKLIIEAHREVYDSMDYSSARLVTRGKQDFETGYLEVRAKLPSGRGTWPAIWMLGTNIREVGWPTCGEIDIMEHVGFNVDSVFGTIHSGAYNHIIGTQKMGAIALPTAESEYHTYAVDWRDTSITFLVDETPYHHVSRDSAATLAQWPFNAPQYLLLNIAVGGGWGGRRGVDTTIWPQRMEVDWVRAWDVAPMLSTANH